VPKKPTDPRFVQLHLGDLPIASINVTLGLELEPGPVVFSLNAQLHAYRRHPLDFPRCLPFIGSVVANPLYLGDDFRNPGKIELISRIPSLGSALLVALMIERDALGQYHVASFFPISNEKVAGRISKGFTYPTKSKGPTLWR
jgi:hypothetical protein